MDKRLMENRNTAINGTGEKGREKQHASRKLTARERIDLLFDKDTFVETDMYVESRETGFDMEKKKMYGDGVVTGYGKIDGRYACTASQDFTYMGGACGEQTSGKVAKLMDFAAMNGMPFISLNDSGGARVQEGVKALKGYGDVFYRNTRYSGVIPQISAIMGPCAGGAVYSPAITDFIFMVDKSSYMCITGTKIIKAVTGVDVEIDELGGADVHNHVSGVAHMKCHSDKDCIDSIKKLLSYIPNNSDEQPPKERAPWKFDTSYESLNNLLPDSVNVPYDMKQVITKICDSNSFFELQPQYAPNIIIGFARIDGHSVGIVANQPMHMAGCLDCDSSDKGARFVRFCDCFNIPIITFTDVPGYMPGVDQEHGGIIRHGAKLLYAFSEASVMKINIITRKAYGGAYIAMNSMHLGADFVYAWPNAEIAVMGAEGAANLVFANEIKSSANPEETRKQKIDEYRDKLCNPYEAAKLGYINDVISPSETREKLVAAINLASRKRDKLPAKKHGNFPV